MAKLTYSSIGFDPTKVKPLSFNPVNPNVQDNTNIQYKPLDPVVQIKRLQIANSIKEQKKKDLELKIYNERKTQRFLGDGMISAEERDLRNKDYAKYAANAEVESDYTPIEDKAKDFALNFGMAILPEIAIAKGFPLLKALKRSTNVAREGDEILPLVNMPKPEPIPNTLTLRSISSGNPLEKQLGKAGDINVGNIRNYLLKPELSTADKTIMNNVLDTKYPNVSKVNYNEFKQSVSDELVPLNKTLSDDYANYGIDRLGWEEPGFRGAGLEPTPKHLLSEADILSYPKSKSIVFSNHEQFGIGDAKHFFDRGTLGHSRYMVTNEESDVYHLLENQSDYFQKKLSPEQLAFNRVNSTPHMQEVNKKVIENVMVKAKADQELAKNLRLMYENGTNDRFGNPVHLSQVEQFEGMAKETMITANIRAGNLRNIEQKAFLGKTHQDRLLQENVAYAAKNGQTKMRIPTSETAVKIEGYPKARIIQPKDLDTWTKNNERLDVLRTMKKSIEGEKEYDFLSNEQLLINRRATENGYSPEHQTVLKKYDDMPKNVKKLFGIDTKTVTDAKGNSWFEFDIPKKFITGGAEIKALSLLPVGIGLKHVSNKLQKKQ